jgi:hypothetical protein
VKMPLPWSLFRSLLRRQVSPERLPESKKSHAAESMQSSRIFSFAQSRMNEGYGASENSFSFQPYMRRRRALVQS